MKYAATISVSRYAGKDVTAVNRWSLLWGFTIRRRAALKIVHLANLSENLEIIPRLKNLITKLLIILKLPRLYEKIPGLLLYRIQLNWSIRICGGVLGCSFQKWKISVFLTLWRWPVFSAALFRTLFRFGKGARHGPARIPNPVGPVSPTLAAFPWLR